MHTPLKVLMEVNFWLSLDINQLTGEIPPEIGNLTNLGWLYLNDNQLTGEIPPEVCDLIESNNLDIANLGIAVKFVTIFGQMKVKMKRDSSLNNNNLINTCED